LVSGVRVYVSPNDGGTGDDIMAAGEVTLLEIEIRDDELAIPGNVYEFVPIERFSVNGDNSFFRDGDGDMAVVFEDQGHGWTANTVSIQ
jgi:hypothetical protein